MFQNSSSQSSRTVRLVSIFLAVAVVGFLVGSTAREGGNGDSSHAQAMAGSEDSSQHIEALVAREVRSQLIHKVSEMQNHAASSGTAWPPVRTLPESQRKRILITGGAGFVGSNLVDRLMMEGHEVIVLDNMFTGRKKNVQHWIGHPSFQMIVGDVVNPVYVEVDQIYHLACPASPPHYQYNPIKTIKTSTEGTLNMLGLAKRVRARILLTSTSEIYGDPEEHPQRETYWGNVNAIGPRACYDEGKRVAETMMYAYKNQENVEVRVARIFNTFGPRMHPNDGRVVSNFIIQALQGKPITIYGEGRQTRSFQYVDDLVDGLIRLMNGEYDGPVNLGNPEEYQIGEFARVIHKMVGSNSTIVKLPPTTDDPNKRRPDISLAMEKLGWRPQVKVSDGLMKTVDYFRSELEQTGEIVPTGPQASRPKPAAGH
uniref:UDP-glucuronate decarboxylase n=1 Tax=Rhizochromulina marina TaxID=1034831 RepID=A0A7S2WCV9_9STRA